ncbi:MAG: Gldg family protein [Bacteriovoracaceae bacterium]
MKGALKSLLWICNIIFYLLLVATWIAIPDEVTLNISFTIFNLSFSALMIIWDRQRFALIYKSQKFKGFSDTLISAFLIFCILGLINYWVFKHPSFIDLSKNNNNSLTDQTVQILKSLDQPITLKVFSNKQQMVPIKALLEMYRYAKSDTSIEFIDVELRPDLVKKHEVLSAPTLLVQYNERSVKIVPKSELNITNALLRVSRVKDPVLYFTTGHGEADIYDKSDAGLMSFSKLLQGHLFDVQSKNLATLDTITDKAQAIVIWGAQSDFHDHEIKLLENYLNSGGQLVVALDPNFSKDPVPKLRAFLKSQGIIINNDLVIDSIHHYSGSQGTIPLIKKFGEDHLIVSQFKGPIFFPLASSV